MPEAEIKIKYPEVIKAQQEVAKLRQQLQDLSKVKGTAGGQRSPLAPMTEDAKKLGTQGVDSMARARGELGKLADAGRLAHLQARALVSQLLRIAGPAALIGGVVSAVGGRMAEADAKLKQNETDLGKAQLARAAGSRLTDEARESLYKEFVPQKGISPSQFESIVAEHGTSPARARRALETAAVGGEGIMSRKRIASAQAARDKLFTESPSARKQIVGQETEAFRAEIERLQGLPKQPGPFGGQTDPGVADRIRELQGAMNRRREALMDNPDKPVYVREQENARGQGRP